MIGGEATIHDAVLGVAEAEHLEALDSPLFSGCETDDSKLRAMCSLGHQVAFRWKDVNSMKKTMSVIASNFSYDDGISRWITDVNCTHSPREDAVISGILKREMELYKKKSAVGRSEIIIQRMKHITKKYYPEELSPHWNPNLTGRKRTRSNLTGGDRSIGRSIGSTSNQSSVGSGNGSINMG